MAATHNSGARGYSASARLSSPLVRARVARVRPQSGHRCFVMIQNGHNAGALSTGPNAAKRAYSPASAVSDALRCPPTTWLFLVDAGGCDDIYEQEPQAYIAEYEPRGRKPSARLTTLRAGDLAPGHVSEDHCPQRSEPGEPE
jgi:hypothetical protein